MLLGAPIPARDEWWLGTHCSQGAAKRIDLLNPLRFLKVLSLWALGLLLLPILLHRGLVMELLPLRKEIASK